MDYPQLPNKVIEDIKLNAYMQERTIYINDSITDETEFLVNRMFERIVKKDDDNKTSMAEREPITLKISSPGGSVYSMFSIISTIESLKNRGYTINAYSYGMSMSAAFMISIICTKRFVQKYSRLMYHQPHRFVIGYNTVEDFRRDSKEMDSLWETMQEIITKYTKIDKKTLDTMTRENRDVFMYGDEAIKLGVADEIF
jgi:ATP-dependent protease ClpP protease subunit